MEVKRRLALQHIETGLYLSWSPDNYPHTKRIDQARRFYGTDEMKVFLEHSPYRPENPEEYEIATIRITYEREDTGNENSESGT